MPGFVALTGPPAVGKTTLSAQLAAVHGAQVFRLREFAQGFRHRPDADPALFATEDPLGWFSDQTVRVLLDVALLGREPTGVTVLETPRHGQSAAHHQRDRSSARATGRGDRADRAGCHRDRTITRTPSPPGL